MNFRNTLIIAGSAVALSGLATSAFASGSVSATANATATVLAPTTLTKTQDIAFGSVVRPANATTNTVLMDTNGNVTLTGTGNGSVVASTTTAAKFNLVAPAGTTYATTQVLNFTQTGLVNIAASLPAASTGSVGTVPAGGAQTLAYGGQFDISSGTAAQAYTGTLVVTVNYN